MLAEKVENFEGTFENLSWSYMGYDQNLLEKLWTQIKSTEEAVLSKENILDIEETITSLREFDDHPEEYENPEKIHKYLGDSLSL